MSRFGGYSRLKFVVALLVVIIVAILLEISSPLPLPAQRTFSEGFTPPPKQLSLSRGDVYTYDLNITYQSPHTNVYETPNSTVYGLLSKPPQNTPSTFWNLSLTVGFDANFTDSPSQANLWILEPFGPPGHTLVYDSPLPLPNNAGQLSVVSIQLLELGLYRIEMQNTAASTVVGIWTFEVRYSLFNRPQSNYATAPLVLALVIAVSAPVAFYVNQRRSHRPSSVSSLLRFCPNSLRPCSV